MVSGNGDFKTVADEIKNVPTVIFFDNEGKAIGNPIVGAKENLKEYYTEEINKRLKSLHKSQIDLIEESAIETTGYKDNVNKKMLMKNTQMKIVLIIRCRKIVIKHEII